MFDDASRVNRLRLSTRSQQGYFSLLHPQPPPRRMKGVRNYTGTLYLLFQTLMILSLITKSKYHIQRYKNKTTTVVVFTVSIHTILRTIYIYIYKNCTFTTSDRPLQVCWRSRIRKIVDILCHTPIQPPLQTKGARICTGTLYLHFQTLVDPSLITESKYHIQGYKNKTTTVVVFTVPIYTVLSPIYIYIYKNCTFTFT